MRREAIWVAIAAAVAGVLVNPRVLPAGSITGTYYFLGIGNDPGFQGDNDMVKDALAKYLPWKDAKEEQIKLLDNVKGSDIIKEIEAFHARVKSDDVFIFYYGGHSTLYEDDNSDEPAAHKDEEGIGIPGHWVRDDQLAADKVFGCFPECSTIITIFNTCFGGGFIGGSSDLDRDKIKNKHNLLFMSSAPETGLCGDFRYFPGVLSDALAEGIGDGDKQIHASEWAKITKRLWKERLSRDMVVGDFLDANHNATVAAIPEPLTLLGLLPGVSMLAWYLRRRAERSLR